MKLLEDYYQSMVDGYEKLKTVDTDPHRFRGANSGCMLEDGRVIGANPRTAILRYHQVEEATTFEDELLFQAGHFNEDALACHLEAAGVPFKREEEIPVRWSVEYNGVTVPVTGRPDFILYPDDPDKAFGIELKGIFSAGTMVDVAHFAGGNPKAINIVQAAHYSYKNGYMPWILQYINRSYHNAFYYGAARFPVQHQAVRRDEKTGKVVVVGPFTTLYQLGWKDDCLFVNNKKTLITGKGIDKYYTYLLECIQENTVPISHAPIDIWGTKMKKDKESQYYLFKDIDHEQPLTDWIQECRSLINQS